ncbi:hypothetical protein ACOXY8_03510 [Cytophagales bacterium SYC-11]
MLAALRTHFKREKKKGKKRKEKAFGQVGMDRAVKVFWKNTSANWRRRFFQKPEGLDLDGPD